MDNGENYYSEMDAVLCALTTGIPSPCTNMRNLIEKAYEENNVNLINFFRVWVFEEYDWSERK